MGGEWLWLIFLNGQRTTAFVVLVKLWGLACADDGPQNLDHPKLSTKVH